MNRTPEDDVAAAINMTNLCTRFRCLPDPGGLLQQDAFNVWIMQHVLAAQDEREELDSKKQESKARRVRPAPRPRGR